MGGGSDVHECCKGQGRSGAQMYRGTLRCAIAEGPWLIITCIETLLVRTRGQIDARCQASGPKSPTDPYPNVCLPSSARGDATVVPLARVTERGPAQPEPSPSPAFHHHRHLHWHWQLEAGERRVEDPQGEEGSLAPLLSRLRFPHCLIFAYSLTFSFSTATLSSSPKPSSLRLVSPWTPLSSDFPCSQGCTLCSALGPTTPTIFPCGISAKKFGLLYGPARRWTAPQYPTELQTSGTTVYPGHRTLLTCGKQPRSLWGKVWIQRPILPWSVDSCGQPPNLKSPSSCALSSRVQPILPVLPSLARSCESRLAHYCPIPSRPDCLLVLSAPGLVLVRLAVKCDYARLQYTALPQLSCPAPPLHLRLHKVD